MSRKVLCACHCQGSDHPNNMVTVTAEYRQLTETELRTRPVKRFLVLRQCEEPFKRELNAIAILRQLAKLHEDKPWWVRFDNAHLVFQAQYLYLRRNRGRHYAIRSAAQVAIVFSAPEWLSEWLAKRWAPKPPLAQQGFVPTVVPKPDA